MINQCVIDMTASGLIVFDQYSSFDTALKLEGLAQLLYCKLVLTKISHTMLFGVSGYNFVALSFERYSAILNPLQYDEKKVSTLFVLMLSKYDDKYIYGPFLTAQSFLYHYLKFNC